MANIEDGATAFFSADHTACDEAWAKVEASGGDAKAISAAFHSFEALMDRHLRMEEEVLFPAFEAATGMRGVGPTEVMRHEHRQMRAILSDMNLAVSESRTDNVLDLGDTLLMLIQQHNAKEEGMLYPMADAQLGDEWPELAKRLHTYLARPA
ncbi:MAG: hemerythrin domain-containing protein [Deltaproteobacteria bacterium]|nr:hemerythrin domain-containing protein [Deltaproteobacteria bacterium]